MRVKNHSPARGGIFVESAPGSLPSSVRRGILCVWPKSIFITCFTQTGCHCHSPERVACSPNNHPSQSSQIKVNQVIFLWGPAFSAIAPRKGGKKTFSARSAFSCSPRHTMIQKDKTPCGSWAEPQRRVRRSDAGNCRFKDHRSIRNLTGHLTHSNTYYNGSDPAQVFD